MVDKRVGGYSFIIGVILAIVLGLASGALGAEAATWLGSLLVVLGLIVGFLNVTGKETKEFLIVAAILVLVAYAGNASTVLSFGGGTAAGLVGAYIAGIFNHLLAFVVPATIVVALKDILSLAQHP